ncbi:ABC transporter permease [Candidatus Entotheonella palauensis]|uniref:ABC transporter permease n=1 Tax=Candidatus Entotheonella gemina TaxID=1429439 RepID=W4LLA9_9BACT|nr:ABC-2 family transporter protein [Candidatus Entotheonella palauensis]ETW98136.1 MAG: hypothetical protein ETSY2_43255 [Candidatus Entotheonella gemina]
MRYRLRPYASVVSARYRMLLQYRAAAIAGFGTQLFWGFIRLMILAAFYSASRQTPPMSMAEIVDYVWLGQAMFAILPWNADTEFVRNVRSGAVAYELLRPLDLYTLWFASALAFRTAPMSLRCIPLVTVSMGVLPWLGFEAWALKWPPSLIHGGLFIVSFGLAILLSTCLTMLMHISMLWTISSQGIDRVVPAITVVLSGMVVPLPLYPDWLQPLFWLQPFRGLVDVPFRIYSGNMPLSLASVEMMGQLLWIGALVTLGRFLLARGTRKLVVQGG